MKKESISYRMLSVEHETAKTMLGELIALVENTPHHGEGAEQPIA